MPHIAVYIKEALSEEKFSEGFHSRIDARVQAMNTAQLQKMHDHLISTASSSGFRVWGEANKEVLEHFDKVLEVRLEEERKERKRIEALENKRARKEELERLKIVEAEKVMRMIRQTAMDKAAKTVRDNELKRQVAERLGMIQRVADAERKQWEMAAYLFVGVFVCITVVALTATTPLILGCCLGGIFAIAIYLSYRVYKITDIKPLVVTEEDLAKEIEIMQQSMVNDAMGILKQKEIEFKQRLKVEKVRCPVPGQKSMRRSAL